MLSTGFGATLMPRTYVKYLVRHFEDIDSVLGDTGIDALDFFESNEPITVAQHFACFANAAAISTKPDWHLEWGTLLAETAHGPLTPALLAAPTLGDGIDAFLRYIPSRVPYLTWMGTDDGEWFSCEIGEVIDLGMHRRWFIEIPLMVMHTHLRRMHSHLIEQSSIELAYDVPADPADCSSWFACPVSVCRLRNALVFPSKWRRTVNVGYDEGAWLTAISRCEAACKSGVETETLAAVRRLLHERVNRAMTDSLPTLESVAAKLNISGRTLTRRLRALNTHYQAECDDILKWRARELIGNPALSTSDIASTLGYHDVSTFRRSFKRWFGVSPQAFRHRLVGSR